MKSRAPDDKLDGINGWTENVSWGFCLEINHVLLYAKYNALPGYEKNMKQKSLTTYLLETKKIQARLFQKHSFIKCFILLFVTVLVWNPCISSSFLLLKIGILFYYIIKSWLSIDEHLFSNTISFVKSVPNVFSSSLKTLNTLTAIIFWLVLCSCFIPISSTL